MIINTKFTINTHLPPLWETFSIKYCQVYRNVAASIFLLISIWIQFKLPIRW